VVVGVPINEVTTDGCVEKDCVGDSEIRGVGLPDGELIEDEAETEIIGVEDGEEEYDSDGEAEKEGDGRQTTAFLARKVSETEATAG